MTESPIERQQREFVAQSKLVGRAKTAGSEYVGITMITLSVLVIVGIVFLLVSVGG